MTHEPDPLDQVRAVIERYLSGQLSFDAAADALNPILHTLAKQQERLWRERERQPDDPIRITSPSVEQWRNPNTARGDVITPISFAPGRSREDEEKAQALFHEASRRTFGGEGDAA